MSETISGAGPHGSVADSDRIPASKGPFTPGTAGYHDVASLKAAVIAALGAADVAFTPYDDIAATNVQDAIEETADKRVKKAGDTMTGELNIFVPGANTFTMRGDGFVAAEYERYSTNIASAVFSLKKARGTQAAPSVPVTNDRIGDAAFLAWTGAAFTAGARLRSVLIETATVSPSAIGSRIEFSACAIGSGSETEIMNLTTANGVQMFGANTVIGPNRLFRNRAFTVATLPASGIANGDQAIVTDASGPVIGSTVTGGGAVRCMVAYDGTNWRVV